MKTSLRVALPVIVVLIAAGLAGWWGWRAKWFTGKVPPGQALYEEHCAVCHGIEGDGQGKAAYLLRPKPRNFRAGKFRLVTSEYLQPTREDLFRTINNGMPGTPMPSWAHLPESDRWALADYVLELNREGWYERGIELGHSQAEASQYAEEMIDPGEPIAVPPEPPITEDALREGRQLYLTACANCHGKNGEGRRDSTWRTAEGYPTWSRNLRTGVFKGGRESTQLYIRFSTGLPGTPMPNQALSPEQVWRVVQYVQGLSDPTAQEKARVRSVNLRAAQVTELPAGPDDAAWESAPQVRIALMPLWWHEGYVDAVWVKVVHDGEQLAFLLEWNDGTQDTGSIRQQDFTDGAAVQMTASKSPPLFAMGAAGKPVNIWHWKALWDEDKKEFQDVDSVYPQMAADSYYGREKGWKSDPLDDTMFRPAAEVHNFIASSHRPGNMEDSNAAGFGTLTAQGAQQQNVRGVSQWNGDRWRLQFVREMSTPNSSDVTLAVGQQISVAFAVWDGSAGDRNGQKSVSTWNTLILE